LADQDWIGLMIFKNFADQNWIGFNFIGSELDSDWKISQSAYLWFGYPYLIRLSFFEIQSDPDPVLNCRIRLDCDPETGSCLTLILIC